MLQANSATYSVQYNTAPYENQSVFVSSYPELPFQTIVMILDLNPVVPPYEGEEGAFEGFEMIPGSWVCEVFLKEMPVLINCGDLVRKISRG